MLLLQAQGDRQLAPLPGADLVARRCKCVFPASARRTITSMPRIPENVRRAVADLRQLLESRFGDRLRRATLFGSYARGEAGPESDVDVLVLIDELVHADMTWIYETAADIWMDTGVRLAPLALPTAAYADIERRELLLAADIAREGIPV